MNRGLSILPTWPLVRAGVLAHGSWTSLAITLLLLAGCGPDAQRPSPAHIATPILLVHGLGGDAKSWEQSGFLDYLARRGLRFGGTFRSDSSGQVHFFPAASGGADVFTIEISDPHQSLDRWKDEIREAVVTLTETFEVSRVILVGFSAGGVAARLYAVSWPFDHRVARLVTIASPHLGSEWAMAAQVKADLLSLGGVGSAWREKVTLMFEEAEHRLGVDLNRPVVKELRPVKDNPFLQRLNAAPHPHDVAYVSVVVENEWNAYVWQNLQNEWTGYAQGNHLPAALAEVFNLAMHASTLSLASIGSGGDGVVRGMSQDMARVAYLAQHPEVVAETDSIVGAHHFSVLQQHALLLRAVVGRVQWGELRRARTFLPGRTRWLLDFKFPLATLAEVEVRDVLTGAPVRSSTAVVREEEGVVRATIGPLPAASPLWLRVLVRMPDGRVFERILSSAAPDAPIPMPALPVEPSVRFVVLGAYDLPALKPSGAAWDDGLFSGEAPDVLVAISENDRLAASTARRVDAGRTVSWNEAFDLGLSPLRGTICVQAWDADASLHDLMGSFCWGPGSLPSGSVAVTLDSGVGLDLEIDWAPEAFAIRESLPMYIAD